MLWLFCLLFLLGFFQLPPPIPLSFSLIESWSGGRGLVELGSWQKDKIHQYLIFMEIVSSKSHGAENRSVFSESSDVAEAVVL